ncbi:MAG: hypothetical protein HYS56_02550 [Candidatus Omnitrophica bacterium]|nr:hypothetical protein [Candidatus Omnitrophota bacterium]
MKKTRGKTIGAVTGMVIAGGVLLLGYLNITWNSEVLRSCVHFLSGVPLFLFFGQLNLPEVFQAEWVQKILFLIYWALVGGILGWLLGSRRLPLQATAAVIILALVISHRMVQVRVERELGEISEALGKLFTGRVEFVIEEGKP